jgi:hypothetical protein
MLRRMLLTAIVLFTVLPDSIGADPMIGAIVSQTKQGPLISNVDGAGVAHFMGLRDNDKIVKFRYTPLDEKTPGKEITNPDVKQLSPLTEGKPGRYEIELQRGTDSPILVKGQLTERDKGGKKTLVFFRDQPKK